MSVTLVAAVAANGVIGADGGLPWHLPEDLARFKRLTLGHVLIMGRRTFESTGALPGRTIVVVTRQPDWRADGVEVTGDLDGALARAESFDDEVFVAGGNAVFARALPLADRLALTLVDASPEGDTYFPDVQWEDWQEVNREPAAGCTFVDFVRR